MTETSASRAFQSYARPLEAALACVIQPHFRRMPNEVNVSLFLTLQQGVTQLRRSGNLPGLQFTFSQSYRIIHDRSDRIRGPYWVQVESWAYHILDNDGHDMLVYHWNPSGRHRAPHLHVGSVILNPHGHDLGRRFSKLHISTGPVSIQQIVRMLIEEFNVQPLNENWNDVLVVSAEALS